MTNGQCQMDQSYGLHKVAPNWFGRTDGRHYQVPTGYPGGQ